jgi:hypothetical protein
MFGKLASAGLESGWGLFPERLTQCSTKPKPLLARVFSMSFFKTRSLWIEQMSRDHDLSHLAFRVAWVIANHINAKSMEAWPSIPMLAKWIGVSERTIIRAIDELISQDHIEAIRRKGKRTRYRWKLNNSEVVTSVSLVPEPSVVTTLTESSDIRCHTESSLEPSLEKKHKESLEPQIEAPQQAETPKGGRAEEISLKPRQTPSPEAAKRQEALAEILARPRELGMFFDVGPTMYNREFGFKLGLDARRQSKCWNEFYDYQTKRERKFRDQAHISEEYEKWLTRKADFLRNDGLVLKPIPQGSGLRMNDVFC